MTQILRRGFLAGLTASAASLLLAQDAAAQGMAQVIRLPQDVTGGDQATISRVSTVRPVVALTFDDGPHPRLTPVLLDLLKARNIRATFYVIGQNVARHPRLTARIVSEGHEIGNHTFRHPTLAALGDADIRDELDRTTQAVREATGKAPVTMRPPYGAITMNQRKMVYQTRGLPTVLWSVDPQDWRRPASDVLAHRIVDKAHRGAVILAHDIHTSTIDAMPAAIDGLVERGFQFTTVSELLGWPRWGGRTLHQSAQ